MPYFYQKKYDEALQVMSKLEQLTGPATTYRWEPPEALSETGEKWNLQPRKLEKNDCG